MIDASHPIEGGMPRIPLLPEVRVDPVTRIRDGKPLNISMLHLATHAGTHIDAPSHAIEGAATIDEIDLARFRGPGSVISIDRAAGEQIPVSDVAEASPPVEPGDIVLLHTGWSRRFHEESYFDHPYPSVELAHWLVGQRVAMVGVDCVTVDAPVARRPESFDYPIHRILLGAGIPIIENLRNLRSAAGARVTVTAFPLPVRGGDAGHARVIIDLELPDPTEPES